MIILNTCLLSSLTYVNPTSFGKEFSSYVFLFWNGFLHASFDRPQFWSQKRLQTVDPSPALSRPPMSLKTAVIYCLSYFFPWLKALLGHSLYESSPYLQSSLELLEIFPILVRAIWEQGTRTPSTTPGMCKQCICTVVFRCPIFQSLF